MSELIERKENKISIETVAKIRAAIDAIQENMLQQSQIDVPITHHFSEGVYAREMKLNKDEMVVGKIHKYRSLNIISKGKLAVFSVDGKMIVEAPFTFVSQPGAKRVIVALEDTVWTTIHGTTETDLSKIEDHFIAKDYDQVQSINEEELNLIKEARKCLGL